MYELKNETYIRGFQTLHFAFCYILLKKEKRIGRTLGTNPKETNIPKIITRDKVKTPEELIYK